MEVNTTIHVKIGEPWNFETPEGQNVFTSTVCDKTATDSKNDAYLIKQNHPFIMNGDLINYMVAIHRYSPADNKNFNFYYIPDNMVNKFKDLPNIMESLRFVIIGGV